MVQGAVKKGDKVKKELCSFYSLIIYFFPSGITLVFVGFFLHRILSPDPRQLRLVNTLGARLDKVGE